MKNDLKIFYGSTKLVPFKRALSHANDSISNEVRFVKVKVPRGFPTGRTLKSEEINADADFDGIKSIIFVSCMHIYIYI